ncbi:hypothetical protein BGZ80_009589 [Entomortierella chlamydospora]|uniref:Chaps-domain-containing protein n=1 Tax=Entomortierella chlamydospora TaxID=101097 RepID=A0A9P6MWY9_9FUNG|nr:hypothetical protein BGZ80_009589 [Entomortierella chlamydospora]
MGENLRDIPEFIERELGESLHARTDALGTFKELGAPDLCHIIKVNVKPNVKETSSYHYVSGIDASSSASLAAYLNSLTYAIDESNAWFSKGVQWRIRSGVYCCYNAFSRVDVRVEVKIPGGVESYAVNVRGERQEATAAIWQETFITAMLRSILYSDDANYRIPGFRKLDPIPDVDAEKRFFEAAEQLFFKGWLLGSNPEIQVPTIVNNHLTAAIMKYCQESFRYDLAARFFERLFKREAEVASLLAQAYIGSDEELKAINVLYEALKQFPQSYALLHVQADFLRGKGKLEMALRLAKQAVNCAPSEFVTWAKLTEVYIDLGDYESTDLALLRLPAPSLRGTYASAYNLLTRLVSKIGWDELLRCRSLVFVMEEEYRMQKEAEESIRKGSHARAMSRDETVPEEVPARDQLLSPNGTPIPIIKISTESEREREREQEEAEEEARAKAVEVAAEKTVDENADQSMEDIKLDDLSLSDKQDETDSTQAKTEEDNETSQEHEHVPINGKQIEKPSIAAASDDEDNEDEEVELSFSFSNKRLCDRWLDNLFMVLYEDLRQYTIWRAEIQHFRSVQAPYRKSGTDWEIYGDLATRLHHREEAKDAYQRCVDQKFSAKALVRLLEIYADEGQLLKAMEVSIKLCVYQERWYQETVFPTAIAHNLNKLIQSEGLEKVQNTLIALNTSPAVYKLMSRYLTRAKTFEVPGSSVKSRIDT